MNSEPAGKLVSDTTQGLLPFAPDFVDFAGFGSFSRSRITLLYVTASVGRRFVNSLNTSKSISIWGMASSASVIALYRAIALYSSIVYRHGALNQKNPPFASSSALGSPPPPRHHRP